MRTYYKKNQFYHVKDQIVFFAKNYLLFFVKVYVIFSICSYSNSMQQTETLAIKFIFISGAKQLCVLRTSFYDINLVHLTHIFHLVSRCAYARVRCRKKDVDGITYFADARAIRIHTYIMLAFT